MSTRCPPPNEIQDNLPPASCFEKLYLAYNWSESRAALSSEENPAGDKNYVIGVWFKNHQVIDDTGVATFVNMRTPKKKPGQGSGLASPGAQSSASALALGPSPPPASGGVFGLASFPSPIGSVKAEAEDQTARSRAAPKKEPSGGAGAPTPITGDGVKGEIGHEAHADEASEADDGEEPDEAQEADQGDDASSPAQPPATTKSELYDESQVVPPPPAAS